MENIVSDFTLQAGEATVTDMVSPDPAKNPLVGESAALSDIGEPPWRQRAVDRSTQSVRLRAAKRVQRFLNTAREIIAENRSVDFTVQEVVDRSNQSLRSFYQYFDGKHGLLLALFEEETDLAVRRFRESAVADDPLDRLRQAVLLLYELASPGRISVQPLFADFAQRLVVDHPEEVAAAFVPLGDFFRSIVDEAAARGLLRPGRPHRLASVVLSAATMTAGRNTGGPQPISGDEVWEFIQHAIVSDDILAARAGAAGVETSRRKPT